MAVLVRRLSLLALVLLVAACSGGRREQGTRSMNDPRQASSVTITNQSWLQVVMYVERSGQRVRLGDVQSQGTQTFRLPSGLQYGTIRFVADPVGASTTAQSFDTSLSPGQTLSLTIPPSAFR